jgi:hypothetical protein
MFARFKARTSWATPITALAALAAGALGDSATTAGSHRNVRGDLTLIHADGSETTALTRQTDAFHGLPNSQALDVPVHIAVEVKTVVMEAPR